MTLSDQLAALAQKRDFPAVVAAWQGASGRDKSQEVAARMAAAAYAQLGNLEAANSILSDVLTTSTAATAEAATWALGGRVSFDLSRFAESVGRWEQAVAMNRANVAWWRWFADASLKAAVPERALRLASIHRVLMNQDAELAVTLVTLLVAAGRCDEALIEFERVLARWPHHSDAGPAFAEFVMREYPIEALELLDRVGWRPEPRVLSAAEVRAAVLLPAFYETTASADSWHARLLSELRALTVLATGSALTGLARGNCLASTPFFAAYLERDVTDIQCAWGDFVEALCAPLRNAYPQRTTPLGKVKTVGIVSNRLTDSSAGRFFNPWLQQLKDDGFDVRLYSIANWDDTTERLSKEFLTYRVASDQIEHWQALANRIYEDQNDVLLYPEPQGSQLIQLIAGLGLAPIQCAAFGNPLTTGLVSMNYFFVPDAAEVANPAAHYREQVVRLAGLGTTVAPSASIGSFSRESFGFQKTERIYLVSQQLQKWTPAFIDALIQILRTDASGRLVYFVQNSVLSSRAFELLLRRKFLQQGVDYGRRVTVIGNLAREDYLAIHRAADVGLDTFGFSGGSSTLDALAVGLPVVTLDGHFLRGRQSAAMVRRASRGDLVASSVEEFVRSALTAVRPTVAAVTTAVIVENQQHAGEMLPIYSSVSAFLRTLTAAGALPSG